MRDLIKSIKINEANLQFIAQSGRISGSLLTEIERVMREAVWQSHHSSTTGIEIMVYTTSSRKITFEVAVKDVARGFIHAKDFCNSETLKSPNLAFPQRSFNQDLCREARPDEINEYLELKENSNLKNARIWVH